MAKLGSREAGTSDTVGKITAVALKALLKKRGRHADGEGLYLRVVGDNKVYWVFRYTLKGAAREMALGPHPELGLTEARDKLRDLRKQVKVKRDVLIERTTAIVPSEKPTFAKAAADFISLKQTKWKGENRRAILEALLRIYCGPINSKPVDQVTSDDIVMKVLSPIWAKHPVTAVRLRGLNRADPQRRAGAWSHRRRQGQSGALDGPP